MNLSLWLDAALNIKDGGVFSMLYNPKLDEVSRDFFFFTKLSFLKPLQFDSSTAPAPTLPVPHASMPTHTYQTEIILSSGHAADCF